MTPIGGLCYSTMQSVLRLMLLMTDVREYFHFCFAGRHKKLTSNSNSNSNYLYRTFHARKKQPKVRVRKGHQWPPTSSPCLDHFTGVGKKKKGRLVLTYDLLLIINRMIKAEGKRETMTKKNRMQPGLNFAGPSKTFQTLNAQRHSAAVHVTSVARAFTARGALGRGGGNHLTRRELGLRCPLSLVKFVIAFYLVRLFDALAPDETHSCSPAHQSRSQPKPPIKRAVN